MPQKPGFPAHSGVPWEARPNPRLANLDMEIPNLVISPVSRGDKRSLLASLGERARGIIIICKESHWQSRVLRKDPR
jgi:hypothetical protein